MAGLTLAVLLRVPLSGVRAFQDYEARVLPLLAGHGGRLERRLRNADGTVELHVLSFASRQHYEAFRNDPVRHASAPLLAACGATAELLEMVDVAADGL